MNLLKRWLSAGSFPGKAGRAAAGAGAHAAAQMLTVIALARLGSAETLGRYALAVAVVTPALLAARLQLRGVLAADFMRGTPFACYALARAASTAAALAALGLWTASAGYSASVVAAIALFAAARAAEDAGDLLYGVLQREERWNRIAFSQAVRGWGALALIAAIVWSSGSLAGALAAAALWQVAVTVGLDWPAARKSARAEIGRRIGFPQVFALVRRTAPLGLTAALVSLTAYLPRYVIAAQLGERDLGLYAALSQLALVGNLAVQGVGQAALPRIGRLAGSNRGEVRSLVNKMRAAAAALGWAGTAFTALLGEGVLRFVYGAEYASRADVLVVLAGGAALTYLTVVQGYALTALGVYWPQAALFALSAAVGLLASLAAVPAWGLIGAAWANLGAWATAAAGAAALLRGALRPELARFAAARRSCLK